MGQQLELYDARVSFIREMEGSTEIHFSYAYIHSTVGTPGRDSGRSWTQEAILVLNNATLTTAAPSLPDSIIDGYLKHAGKRIELLPLPFEKSGEWLLHLSLAKGTSLEIQGNDPVIKLEGRKIFLEGF